MLSANQKKAKRSFDFIFSIILFFFVWWIILLLIVISFFDTKKSGIIVQRRIGWKGLPFKIYKIRTMKFLDNHNETTITTKRDKRITKTGKFIRRYKLDELPQIINVIIGNMSFVGPRPDVDGYANKLEGDDRIILTIKPGITGPASIYFRNEEDLLEKQINPKEYNDLVLWPKKIELNKKYIENYTMLGDIIYLYKTLT